MGAGDFGLGRGYEGFGFKRVKGWVLGVEGGLGRDIRADFCPGRGWGSGDIYIDRIRGAGGGEVTTKGLGIPLFTTENEHGEKVFFCGGVFIFWANFGVGAVLGDGEGE